MSMVFPTDTTANINNITFAIGLAPGAPPIDLTKMKIVFSTPTHQAGNPFHKVPLSGNTIFTT